uniref:Reverse transcriptase domain-containing protein n=1 Tax=Tanacetum cinerariifolium TaxID=118510 RepID=A0A6L2P200_TANCI|nr:reverse transcriptase domain-containing protein [Tanacetum cinerariifolium]
MAAEVPQTLEYMGGQLNAAPLLEDFQDSHDDEKNTKSSQKYLNDLEEDFQARALLAKSKKFFKKGSQRFNSAKATKDTQYHKCGRNGHFVRDCFSKTLVHSFPSPSQNNTQPRLTCSSHHKTESKDFEVKYNKVKAKLALLSPGASASSSTLVKNKGLVTETCKWDEEDVSSDDNEVIEVKDLMALTEEETVSVSKEFESQRNSTDHPVTVIDSSETESDSTDESSVWSTSFPPLEKPGDAEPVSRSKTVKTTFKSICTFKTKALKGIIPNEPSSYLAQENKKASALKSNPAPAKNSKNVKITDNLYLATHLTSLGRSSTSKNPRPSKRFFPPYTHCGSIDHLSDDCLYYPVCKICGSYDHKTNGHNRIISLEREINPRNPQHPFKRCEVCGSSIHTTIDHYDIEWEAFTRSLIQYKKYLSEFWYSAKDLDNSKVSFSIPNGGIYGELGVNTFRKAIGAHYLSQSSDYVNLPSIDIVRPWFLTIGYEEEVSAKGTLKKSTKPEAKAGHRKQSTSSKQPPSSEATKASVIIHSESASRYDASADSIAEADLGTSSPNDSLPPQQDKTKSVCDGLETVLTSPEIGTSNAEKPSEEINFKEIKLEDLAKLVSNVKADFKDMDSPEYDHIIVVDDSEEDEKEDKNKEIYSTTNDATKDILASTPLSPRNSLPTELKELPSKFKELIDEVKALKTQVHGLEIKVSGDLKELPTKLEEFTMTVTSLTHQVTELKTLQWKLPVEFLLVPNQVASVQAKIKTSDALNAERTNLNKPQPETTTPPIPPIIPPVITTTTTQMQSPFLQSPPKSSSQPKGEHIKNYKGKKALSSEKAEKESTDSDSDDNETHVTGSIIESSRIKKKEAKAEAAKRKSKEQKEELVDLLGPEVVNKKGPITMKVYKEDDISEIIPEFKASDLHLEVEMKCFTSRRFTRREKDMLQVKKNKADLIRNDTSKVGNGYSEKEQIEANTDKTKHEMEKREMSKSTKSKSTKVKVKVKDGAEIEEMLNGLTRTHLMGRCMRTCSSSNLPGEFSPNLTSLNLRRRNRRCSKQPFILEESPVDTMVDQRTMAELLRAPTEGYVDAIVVPPILAEHFELKHSLINMMTSDQFFGLEKDNPHDHIRWFDKLTSTIKYKDVPNTEIKLMLFPFSLAGAARRWLEKEPPCSILTWEDFVFKFINEFFPPSRRTNLHLLRTCPHHGFTKLHQLDTFYNALNMADQDSLNSAAGGNLLERRTQDVLTFIENKFKIAKLTHAVNQQTSAVTTAMTAILKQFQATPPPASVKDVEEICVTCGVVPLSKLEKIKKMNEINIKAMQTKINNVKNELRNEMKTSIQVSMSNQTNELKNMMASFFQMNTASTSGPGPLPSNTIANPKGELKTITTRSGIVLDGSSVPMPPPFINPEEDDRVEETLTDPELGEFTIMVPPPLKMLKALLFYKEKLLELENTPLNENCSAVILKKLPEKLGDPRKFLIPCGFSELKCKALADLGASINLMPLSMLKKLGLPELISTRMTLELANRAICTSAGIARYVFVPVGKFTFPTNFVIVDYESDPRVLLILGRPFLQTARALIDVHGEEMILRDGRLVLIEKLLNLDSTKDLLPPHNINPLSGSATSSSPNHLLEEFVDELALITFPPGNDDLPFDIESDLREIEYLLNHDPTKEMDSILEDNLANPNVNLFDTIPEMFTNEHTLDYSSPPLYDDYNDDLFELEFDTVDVYNDSFDSKGEKIKESRLLIDELDLPRSSDFLHSSEYDSFLFEDFSEVDALPSTNYEDKVFNLGILIYENLFEVTTRVAPDKDENKLAISHASLILEDFNPPLYEFPFHKEVYGFETLLSFSSENEEKVFNLKILTSKGVHSSLLPELYHRGPKAFKAIQIFKSPMEIFSLLLWRGHPYLGSSMSPFLSPMNKSI